MVHQAQSLPVWPHDAARSIAFGILRRAIYVHHPWMSIYLAATRPHDVSVEEMVEEETPRPGEVVPIFVDGGIICQENGFTVSQVPVAIASLDASLQKRVFRLIRVLGRYEVAVEEMVGFEGVGRLVVELARHILVRFGEGAIRGRRL